MILQLILSFCLFGASYGRTEDEIKAWFYKEAIECSKEHPVSPDELDMMQKNQMAASQNAKCLTACVFRKSKWVDDKGFYDLNSAHAFVNEEYADDATKKENANKLFDLCEKVNEEKVEDGEKGCDRSFYLAKCLIDNGPKMGFTV